MKIFKNNKLGFRLLSIIIVSVFLGSLVVGIFLYQQFQDFFYHRFNVDLQKKLDIAEYSLSLNDVLDKNTEELKRFADRFAVLFNCRVTIIDSAGYVLADSEVPIDQLNIVENHLKRDEVQQAISQSYGNHIRHSATIGQNLYYMAKGLNYHNRNIGFLRLAIMMADVDNMLAYTRNYIIAGSFSILLLSALMVFLFLRKINKNLLEITNKSMKIAQGDLSARISVDSRDELFQLGKNINEMASRLSESLIRLQSDKYNLNTVLSSVHDGIIAIDSAKKIMFFNNQALLLLEDSDQNILEQTYYEAIRNQHINSLISSFFEKPVFIRDTVQSEERILDVVITSFKTQDNKGQGAVVVLRDITQYTRLAKIRREFVANVSHEFKTPLAAIRGYSETLLDWGMEDESIRKKYLEKIVKQSNQLENLVSDLLDLARIEKLENIEFKAFSPQPIIKDILAEMADAAANKQISIQTNLLTEKYSIVGDPDMFHSIMINLVDNAVKYTPAGGKITVESKSMKNQVAFIVSDTGIGIPEKDQSRIFERFYRVDKARSRSIGGTGLGLSIVKHLAELQKAEVKLDSEPGKGSRFSVWFNMQKN
ncbi:MAG: HAMP domain-containing protein [Calditrichae bacterium]|nr:HAMP domain-containing protein [Calditrichota bacterium]MCB9056991.1 HAMP domain-containing protein [Calditrichia bacterium]